MSESTQEELLLLAIKLHQENPQAPIRTLVRSDETVEDSAFTEHRIHKVELCFWAVYDSRIYTDEDELLDHLQDYEELSEDDAGDIILKTAEQAVVIWTGAA